MEKSCPKQKGTLHTKPPRVRELFILVSLQIAANRLYEKSQSSVARGTGRPWAKGDSL